MDSEIALFVYGVAFLLWLIAFFAILRTFSIDRTLKEILKRLPAQPQQDAAQPESLRTRTGLSTDEQLEAALRGK
jgi:hypothetical protein